MNSVHDLISQFPEDVQALAYETRRFLLETIHGGMEIPDFPAKMIAYGFGNRYKDTVCTLHLSKKEVKVGFYNGTELNDPENLLEGAGKVHKHVKIRNAGSLNEPLQKLIKEALKAYKLRV